MDIPEWLVEAGKVGAGAVAGVFAGTRRMESRVKALEERASKADQTIATHEQTLTEVHETVQADHDLLIQMNAKVDLIMGAMQLRPKS